MVCSSRISTAITAKRSSNRTSGCNALLKTKRISKRSLNKKSQVPLLSHHLFIQTFKDRIGLMESLNQFYLPHKRKLALCELIILTSFIRTFIKHYRITKDKKIKRKFKTIRCLKNKHQNKLPKQSKLNKKLNNLFDIKPEPIPLKNKDSTPDFVQSDNNILSIQYDSIRTLNNCKLLKKQRKDIAMTSKSIHRCFSFSKLHIDETAGNSKYDITRTLTRRYFKYQKEKRQKSIKEDKRKTRADVADGISDLNSSFSINNKAGSQKTSYNTSNLLEFEMKSLNLNEVDESSSGPNKYFRHRMERILNRSVNKLPENKPLKRFIIFLKSSGIH